MSDSHDSAAEEALLLELAQLGMGMARRLHETALATTETAELVALANAYHHTSRGVRQSLALKARFAAGTVAPQPRAPAEAAASAKPRPEAERPDWTEYERPDWNERFAVRAEALDVDLTGDVDACRARIGRDLTVVSRNPKLAAIPALQPHAQALAARTALLLRGTAALRAVDSS